MLAELDVHALLINAYIEMRERDEELLMQMLAELGVHALLINAYIEMREREMKRFSCRCLPNLAYMLS